MRGSKLVIALSLSFALGPLGFSQASPPAAQQHQPARNASPIPNSWKNVPIPPLQQFKPQEPRRVELPNGMVIFLQEDHELPLIDGTIRLRGGSRDEPAEKIGLTSIYGEVWRTGGTASKTGDQLDDCLESRAARVETSGGIDSTFLSWSSLKEDFDQVFPVVLDLLQHPQFREDKIALAKHQIDSAISRRNDDVDEIAGRESAKLAYGQENPYARTAEYYTVDAVTREDLLNWHRRVVAPNNMMLGITGDFDSAAMERKLREAFDSMPRG
ncbi:MAG: M16 family metallopeptidase, partial [Candidatus Angelobacter sp.]